MKVGDLVKIKSSGLIGCVTKIKYQPLAGLCVKILIFEMGEKWIKIDQLRLFDKTDREVYNGRRFKTKID